MAVQSFAESRGQNPFILDSKEPDSEKFMDYIKTEVRYTSLAKLFPDQAEALFEQAKEDSIARYQTYKELPINNSSKQSKSPAERLGFFCLGKTFFGMMAAGQLVSHHSFGYDRGSETARRSVKMNKVRLTGIKVDVHKNQDKILRKQILTILHIKPEELVEYQLVKKSLDARKNG